jgi:dolichyl-diphosphooligosaccharide--protein glycosyltransferase
MCAEVGWEFPTFVLILHSLFHPACSWVTSEAYSSPSIVLISGHGPYRHVLDDFREAYYWLRQNTKHDAKIMSW